MPLFRSTLSSEILLIGRKLFDYSVIRFTYWNNLRTSDFRFCRSQWLKSLACDEIHRITFRILLWTGRSSIEFQLKNRKKKSIHLLFEILIGFLSNVLRTGTNTVAWIEINLVKFTISMRIVGAISNYHVHFVDLII